MSTLRQAFYGLALLGALALLVWAQAQRIEVADKNTELAQSATTAAQGRADRSEAKSNALSQALQEERQAQTKLRSTQDQLRSALANRQSMIEDLKHENSELRKWAGQPLPDAARRLRERPAITGAASYRDWLSGRSAVRPVSDKTGQ